MAWRFRIRHTGRRGPANDIFRWLPGEHGPEADLTRRQEPLFTAGSDNAPCSGRRAREPSISSRTRIWRISVPRGRPCTSCSPRTASPWCAAAHAGRLRCAVAGCAGPRSLRGQGRLPAPPPGAGGRRSCTNHRPPVDARVRPRAQVGSMCYLPPRPSRVLAESLHTTTSLPHVLDTSCAPDCR